ncbi:RraA family protein [Paraburkholderia sp. J12]|uniref:RraA family protein n=1 Tax=Paraburkholderia sp. J12 TaxID=2805432 RepID=UPI002ABD95F2|nr:RraA family protein [Paraburkholderia sp. J12]
MTDENVTRASRLDTATLSDALDKLGLNGQCYAVKPCSPAFRMAGRAWTLLYGPAGHPAGTVGDYIDDVPSGSVVVLDNGGRDNATVWGDILTEVASRNGIAGTVIDGINRDVALCLRLNYPVYSKGSWMRTGKDRVQVEATGIPVNIGDVRVCPGDIVCGDADGVVVIPGAQEQAVLDAAEKIHVAEEAIREAARSGKSLREAREQHRYHQLQTPEANG